MLLWLGLPANIFEAFSKKHTLHGAETHRLEPWPTNWSSADKLLRLSHFSVAVVRYLDRSNLREKGFILLTVPDRIQSIKTGKARQVEQDITCLMAWQGHREGREAEL